MGGFSWQSAIARTSDHFAGVFNNWKNIAAATVIKRLDTEYLKDQLHGLLHGRCVGYAFQLRKNGKTVIFGADGSARIEPSVAGPSVEISFDQDTVMTIASLGKLFTAVLTVRLLDECNISVDATIGPYLPSWWALGQNVSAVTFRQLMTHNSLLGVADPQPQNDTVTETRSILSRDIDKSLKADYRNINFIVLRILIYRILKAKQEAASASPPGITPTPHVIVTVDLPLTDDVLQENSIDVFDAYAQQNLFGPAGVTASLHAPADVAMHFRYPYSGAHGGLPDIRVTAGSGGWYMSLNDTLRTMAAFRRRGVAISPNRATDLEAQGLGFYPAPWTTDIGLFAFKNGGSGVGAEPPYPSDPACVQQTVGAFLPAGMELVVFVNSNVLGTDIPGGPNLQNKVIDAAVNAIRPWNIFSGFG